MSLYEILDNMGYLCDTHDIEFKINEWGLYIEKFFNFNSNLHKFNMSFSFELLKYKDIDDCVLEFERQLENKIKEMKNNEKK